MTDFKNKKIAVLGSGSWPTAIIKILSNNNDIINWWIREPEIIENIIKYKHNNLYLSDVEIDTDKVEMSNNIEQVIEHSDILLFNIPSAFLLDSIKNIDKEQLKNKYIISAIKGIVPQHNLIIADFFNKVYNVPYNNIAVVIGPSHAEEVALEKLTYLTVASQNNELATHFADKLSCRYIKTIVSDDIFGTEYSAVIKNIIALANGICIGLGYGDNFQAVLISNAIQEIKRFVDQVHPIDRDIKSSVYLGDLLVTAYSQFSRNRMFGNMIGKGYSVKTAQMEMNMVAEGYYAAKCIYDINQKYNVDMPITNAVYNILYNSKNVATEIKILTERLN